jgi:hypothetical protein
MNLPLKSRWRCLFVAGLLAISWQPVIAAPKNTDTRAETDLASLDQRFHKFSTQFYTTLIRFDHYPKEKTIDTLVQSIDRERMQGQPIRASAAVMNNLGLVEKNIDTTPIINICALLLEANEWNTASQLYQKVKKQGDKSLVSNVSFSMAKYNFSRNQWKQTIGIIETIRSDLPPEDYYHALFMHGISLQRLQKHRLALAQYAKIPRTSKYYAAARLNMAVANIRQDWWTDAHIIINDLLDDKDLRRDSQLTDRLYTVLGYSLLQQQYYRNSREAFRNVSLDGQYTRKALLGIALTAAYQEDYIGALNAITNLKNSKIRDLPVDEANLLMPYFYEKLQQQTTASAGYVGAINYYEERTGNLKKAMQIDALSIRDQLLSANHATVTIDGETVDLGEKLPKFVFDNIRMLALFGPHVDRMGNAALLREYSALIGAYNTTLQKTFQNILTERSAYLAHYMNQSRYGLARLQDNTAINP